MTAWSIEEEARQAFELSEIYCGDCRDYHLTRAFLKAAGHPLGPERDRALFAPMLRRYAPQGARVLIAGAADTGVLDLTLSTIGDLAPDITVADKCRTPLILCERFAAAQGLSIRTAAVDLSTSHLGAFDLIIGHVVMSFVADDRRLEFLRHMAGMLAPQGTFLLALTKPGAGPRKPRATPEDILAGLASHGVALPGDGTVLTAALRRHLDPARPRSGSARTTSSEALFPIAGLRVVERLDSAAAPPALSDASAPARLYFALGRS